MTITKKMAKMTKHILLIKFENKIGIYLIVAKYTLRLTRIV